MWSSQTQIVLNICRNEVVKSTVQVEAVQYGPPFRRAGSWSACWLLRGGARWDLSRLHVPVAWLLGPVAVGILGAALAGAGLGKALRLPVSSFLGAFLLAMQMARWLMVVLIGLWIARRLFMQPLVDFQ